MQHGFMDFSVEENILIITGQGPWNLDTIIQSAINSKSHIEKLCGTTWGVLVIALGDAILVPEAVARLIEIIKSDRIKGRVATALVIKECGIPQLVESHLGQIYLTAGDEFKCFAEKSAAKNWLEEQIKCPPFVETINDAV